MQVWFEKITKYIKSLAFSKIYGRMMHVFGYMIYESIYFMEDFYEFYRNGLYERDNVTFERSFEAEKI